MPLIIWGNFIAQYTLITYGLFLFSTLILSLDIVPEKTTQMAGLLHAIYVGLAGKPGNTIDRHLPWQPTPMTR